RSVGPMAAKKPSASSGSGKCVTSQPSRSSTARPPSSTSADATASGSVVAAGRARSSSQRPGTAAKPWSALMPGGSAAERFLDLGPEALAVLVDPLGRGVLDRAQLLEDALLLRGEPLGDPHDDAHEQVAPPADAQLGHALAAHLEHGAVLRAGRHAQARLAVQRRHLDLVAEG